MFRVVVDPGVLIAALISSKGAPRALLQAWMHGAFELLVSPKLRAELLRVLSRQKFRRYFTEREAQAYVAFLERFATLCPDVETRPGAAPILGTTTSWPWRAFTPLTSWFRVIPTSASLRTPNHRC